MPKDLAVPIHENLSAVVPTIDVGDLRLCRFLNWGHTLDHLCMLIYPTVAIALVKEWGMGYAELIRLATGGLLAFGLFSMPAGWLADRWSRWGMMVVFFAGLGVATFLTGFAQEPWQIAMGLGLMGVFAAIYHPVGIAMLSLRGVKEGGRLGRTLGLNGFWGNAGLAFAALSTGLLVDTLGWRWAFIMPGLICMATALVFYWTTDPLPSQRVTVPHGLSTEKQSPRVTFPRGFLIQVLLVLAVASAGNSIIFNSATIVMPKLLDERIRNLTQTALGIGAIISAIYLLAGIAQLLVGAWIDKLSLRTVFIPIVALQAPLLVLAAGAGDYVLLLVSVGLMFVVFGQIPVNDAMVARYTTDAWRARAYGIRYVLSFTAGTLGLQWVAWSEERGGFVWLFYGLAGVALCILLASFLCPTEEGSIIS